MLIPDNISDFNSMGERVLYLKFKNDEIGKQYVCTTLCIHRSSYKKYFW